MKASRIALALTVASFALLQACSSEDESTKDSDPFATREPVTFNDNAVNADAHFSDTVNATQADKLVVPTAGNDATLKKLTVGTILAGDRTSKTTDLGTSQNPLGFLREVVEITTDGANTVIKTNPASLDQWIKNGDIYYADPTSLFAGGETQIGTKTLKPLADSGGSGAATTSVDQEVSGEEVTTDKGFKIRPVIRLSNGTLQVNANYDGYFKIRRIFGVPIKVSLKSLLTVDPYVGTDLTVGIKAVGSESGLHSGTTPGITIAEKVIDMPGVVIPLAAPIPITVRFHPRLKCSLAGNGEATATVRAELRVHAAVGFEATASLGGINSNDLSEAPTLSPTFQFKGGQIKATISAQCELVAVPELLAFDAVGLSGEVGPYVGLSLDGCVNLNKQTEDVSGGFALSEQHGLQLQFSARAQLPVVGVGKDFPLLTVRTAQSDPKYIFGSKNTCELKTKDSCDGRTDGFYCSVENAYSGIVCKGQQVDHGLQCATTQTCTGGTDTTINCK